MKRWSPAAWLWLGLVGPSLQCGHGGEVVRVEETRIEPGTPARPEGVIMRSELRAILQAGPGMFLQQVQVAPFRERSAFVGFRIRTWFPGNPSMQSDSVRVGDVVTRVNDLPIERPEQFLSLWASLPTATSLKVELRRAGQPVTVLVPIVED